MPYHLGFDVQRQNTVQQSEVKQTQSKSNKKELRRPASKSLKTSDVACIPRFPCFDTPAFLKQ